MIRDNHLDINKIIKDKKVLKLFRAVESYGGVLRFVGGCVRDALMNIEGSDIDLATDLSPDELVEACQEKMLKTVPIGIKFGTVGVVIDGDLVEVTSLRKDVKTDGRRAEVEFTDNWEIDASRRDLTINAVYADEKGNVFDYYDGINDLEKGIIRFIGDPNSRIQEDYLRVLRFFRFYSSFGKTEIDPKALKACRDNKDGLKKLSVERTWVEIEKLFKTKNAAKTLKIMFDNDLLSHIITTPNHMDSLEFLIELGVKYGIIPDALRRMFVLYQPTPELAEHMATRLKMSRKQRQSFVSWAEIKPELKDFQDERSLTKLVYRHGKEFCYDKLLITLSVNKSDMDDLNNILHKINGMVIPIFPIRGKDVVNLGVNHQQIGKTLDCLENVWITSDFALTREELLNQAHNLCL